MKILDPRTDYEEIQKRSDLGKTFNIEEFGVQFPNGDIVWVDRIRSLDGNIQTAAGRAEAQAEYAKEMARLRVAEPGPLLFIKRIRTVSYSHFTIISTGN